MEKIENKGWIGGWDRWGGGSIDRMSMKGMVSEIDKTRGRNAGKRRWNSMMISLRAMISTKLN